MIIHGLSQNPEIIRGYPWMISGFPLFLKLSLDYPKIIPRLSLDYPWIIPVLSLALSGYLGLSLSSITAGESKLLPFKPFCFFHQQDLLRSSQS